MYARYALTSRYFYESFQADVSAINICCYLTTQQHKSALSERPFLATYANYGMDENRGIIR